MSCPKHFFYHVEYAGPGTTITETPDGEWPRWEMARAAAIHHLEERIAECQATPLCQATLLSLRLAASVQEYRWLMKKREAREAGPDRDMTSGSA